MRKNSRRYLGLMLVVLEKEKDGLIHIGKKDLEDLLKEAYNEGYRIAQKELTITTPTPYPQTIPKERWDWTKVTCADINNNSTITYGGK